MADPRVDVKDRDNLFTYPNTKAAKVFKKGLVAMKTILEELETELTLQTAILGGLQLTHRRITPHAYVFGLTDFGDGLTLPGIM